MITQPMPVDFTEPHTLRSSAGPLTAALTLARQYPHLPMTVVEVRQSHLLMRLHGEDAPAFAQWVTELGLAELPTVSYPFQGAPLTMLEARGSFAEVQVRVQAWPSAAVKTSAVAA